MGPPDRPFRVRRGSAADVPALLDLLASVASEGRWIGMERVDREERGADLLGALANPRDAVFVAEADGEVVGNLRVGVRPYGVADLGMLVALPWRGRGVGTRLLGAGIDWARDAGAHKVALQVWPHNEAARALYRRFGFAEEGVLRRHYRRSNGELWDAVLMGLPLDEPPPEAP